MTLKASVGYDIIDDILYSNELNKPNKPNELNQLSPALAALNKPYKLNKLA